MIKYILAFLVLLFGYVTVRHSAYNVDSAAYFEYLEAKAEADKEYDRAVYCELVWELRKKQSIPLFTNCYENFDSLSAAIDGKDEHKFGTSIFDTEASYQSKINARYKYEYVAKNRVLIGIKALFFIKDEPKLMTREENFHKKCKLNGEDIQVYGKYEYAYHTSKGTILIPEAFKVIDCQEKT